MKRRGTKVKRIRWYVLAVLLLVIGIGIVVYKSGADETLAEANFYAPERSEASLSDLGSLDALKSKNEELRRLGSVKVPILVYHGVRPYTAFDTTFVKRFVVEPKVLDSQLSYLEDQGYTTISLGALVDHFKKKTPLPAKPVVITFDDDWVGQYTYAFPLLEKHNQTATFFVFTVALGKDHFMSYPQLTDLVAHGMEIGDHTKDHPFLFKVTDEKKLTNEIVDSRTILESNLGIPVNVFATPYGETNTQIQSLVASTGYLAARNESWGYYQSEDVHNLTGLEAPNSLAKFKEIMSL